MVPRANEHPRTAKLLAAQNKLQFAVFEVCRSLSRILGVVSALVPNHDRPRPILAIRNIAFKIRVCQGMILNRHREPFDSRIEQFNSTVFVKKQDSLGSGV